MPRLAANLSLLFTELDLLDRFDAAAGAGFRAVEMQFPYGRPAGEIAGALRAAGLEVVLINLPPGDWEAGERGLAALPGRQAAFRAALDQALDTAAALGCGQLHCMAGLAPPGAALEDCEAVFVENLRWATERAGKQGPRLLIEPINDRDLPGYLLTRPAQARRVIEAVGAPNLFLQFDVYHTQIMGGDLTATLSEHWDLIRHVQISGLPGRHEPDERQEINYPYILGLLDELGYGGWVGCEYRPRAGTLEGLAWARPYGIGGGV